MFIADKMNIGPGTWGPNIHEFKRRFDPETTNGEGPQWLKNLYFTYLVELRALVKAAPYLAKVTFHYNKKTFQWGAYRPFAVRPLADHIPWSFGGRG